jgi:anti-sigma factor RsiW
MNCSPSDLKDLFFGELSAEQRGAVEQHTATCARCRDELNALAATRSALLSVRDEEPPRRIAFVSDKVFEPRWWQKIWKSGPQLGFVSSCILALAIVAHALYTPAAPLAPSSPAPVVAQIDQKAVEAAVANRLDAAIHKAVAGSEERQSARLLEFVNTKIRRSDRQYELLVDYIERMDKRVASYRRTALYEPVEVRQ